MNNKYFIRETNYNDRNEIILMIPEKNSILGDLSIEIRFKSWRENRS